MADIDRQVMAHAREEYLFQRVPPGQRLSTGGPLLTRSPAHRYSVYVLESSTSRRLTYFFPPLVRQYSHPTWPSDPEIQCTQCIPSSTRLCITRSDLGSKIAPLIVHVLAEPHPAVVHPAVAAFPITTSVAKLSDSTPQDHAFALRGDDLGL